MVTIEGGIIFEAGKEVPEKFKKFLDTYGFKSMFNPKTTTFTGKNIPKLRNTELAKDITISDKLVITEKAAIAEEV